MSISPGSRLGAYEILALIGAEGVDKLVFIFNFFDELRPIAPVAKR